MSTFRHKIGASMELVVGPITLKMHLNPNATSNASIPFADTVDARQGSLFGAV